jgi:hypothetical protein
MVNFGGSTSNLCSITGMILGCLSTDCIRTSRSNRLRRIAIALGSPRIGSNHFRAIRSPLSVSISSTKPKTPLSIVRTTFIVPPKFASACLTGCEMSRRRVGVEIAFQCNFPFQPTEWSEARRGSARLSLIGEARAEPMKLNRHI